ncbi:MAG: hypothetical protein HY318_01760 [Armatimonadetes bacterium]|nr:hypothetical protein [Armatimonadota bacterium]
MERTKRAAPVAIDQANPLRDWTQHLRDTVRQEATVYTERQLLWAESFRQTEREPFRCLRVARATRHLFEHIPVGIRHGELIVGWHPNCAPDPGTQAAVDQACAYLGDEQDWGHSSEGHMAPDYETVLSVGLEGIAGRLRALSSVLDKTNPASTEKAAFYEAALLSLNGLQHFIRRYAELAGEMASDTTDSLWSQELGETRRVCESIATEPAKTFREALQLTWFLFLAVALENGVSHGCFGPGRMDQYLYPFYRREKDLGTLDAEMAQALIDQFFIKCNEFSGDSMSAVILVVGGRKPDGSSATNPLSFELVKASDRVQMYFPGIDVSWHSEMDPEFVRACCRLLRNGKGQPAFFNSDLIVQGLTRHGIPREHAVDHLPSTCTETSIAGRCNPCVAWPYVNIPMCLIYALFDGVHPITETRDRPATGIPQTYEELREAFTKQLEWAAHEAISYGHRTMLVESWYRPFPLLSCFVQDCLDRGTDISQGGALYNFQQPEAVGISNVVDSLVAVKTLVEDQKRFTVDDFRQAARNDFDGYESLHRAILKECPKYGNDDPWVNDLFAEVAGGWCSAIEGHSNRFGGPVFPGFLGWTVWIGFGNETPATPDGRKAGVPIANSIAPCTGVDLKGTPSMLLSASGFDQSRGLGGTTYNLRFAASSLTTEEGVDRLKGLLEASFELGFYQIQINVVGSAVLREAQQQPENYRDLFVRIGGYLVPFTLLPQDAQNEVIARAEMEV